MHIILVNHIFFATTAHHIPHTSHRFLRSVTQKNGLSPERAISSLLLLTIFRIPPTASSSEPHARISYLLFATTAHHIIHTCHSFLLRVTQKNGLSPLCYYYSPYSAHLLQLPPRAAQKNELSSFCYCSPAHHTPPPPNSFLRSVTIQHAHLRRLSGLRGANIDPVNLRLTLMDRDFTERGMDIVV